MNLESLYYRVISKDRKFYHAPFFLFLRVTAFIYERAQVIRAWSYRWRIFRTRRLDCRVISVGNLTLGGTGKTPMTLWIAEKLLDLGHKPAIVSRGYGGLATDGVHVVSDGHQVLLSPEVAGDEAYMLAKRLKTTPVLTSRNRYEAGRYAIDRFDADTIILDDGFQHLALHRDLNILLCDQKEPLGNGLVFPAGHLREPVQGVERADVICFTRCSENKGLDGNSMGILHGRDGNRKIRGKKKWVVRTMPRLDCLLHLGDPENAGENPGETLAGDFIRKRPVAAFCGIARPDSFREILKESRIVFFRSFPDHYSYTSGDLRSIDEEAKKAGAEYILVTEKDAVKISNHPFTVPVLKVRITLEILEGKEMFNKLLGEDDANS